MRSVTRILFSLHFISGDLEADGFHELVQPNVVLLPGTENASEPFFSPDGEWIGFFAGGKMKKIAARGGPPVTLCEAPAPRGAWWGKDGNIIVDVLLVIPSDDERFPVVDSAEAFFH